MRMQDPFIRNLLVLFMLYGWFLHCIPKPGEGKRTLSGAVGKVYAKPARYNASG
jgi:hypothetical protein